MVVPNNTPQHPQNKTNKSSKLNFKLTDIMRAAMGLAVMDGGFIIAVQIISFLLKYFGANIQITPENSGSVLVLSKTAFIISMLSILNLAVIIYRVTGIARGIKYTPMMCYQHALRRWPVLILLFISAGFFIVFAAGPIARLLTMFNSNLDHSRLLMFAMLLLIPYGVLACIFVVDQQRNPLQAILATMQTIRQRISIRLLMNIAMLYSMPFLLSANLMSSRLAPYIALFNAVWFLFCHMLIVVVYTGATIADNSSTTQHKKNNILIV